MPQNYKIIESWVDTYTNDLFSWAFYKLKNKEQAEDIVQECFISAYINFEKFENKSQPKTWLFSILNNKIYDFIKKENKEKQIFVDDFSNFENKAEMPNNTTIDIKEWQEQHLLDNPEFNQVFENCLNKLPERFKDVLMSKVLFKKKSEEVCQVYSLSASNLWQIIRRSKLLLKDCLELNWVK